jgi:hypothetical protein
MYKIDQKLRGEGKGRIFRGGGHQTKRIKRKKNQNVKLGVIQIIRDTLGGGGGGGGLKSAEKVSRII